MGVFRVLEILFLIFIFLGFLAPSSMASEIGELKKQLKVLEQKIERLEARENEKSNINLEKKVSELEAKEKQGKGKVGTFIADHISFGGFFEHAVTANLSEDRPYQLSANSHILGLNLGVKLNEKFRLVSQELFVLGFSFLNPHDVTKRDFGNNPTFGAVVAHAYGEYTYSDKLKIQSGLGWVPFGISLANRELPLLIRRNGPMLASGGLTMSYALWTGLHVLGAP